MRKSFAWAAPAAVVSVAVPSALALDRQGHVIPQAKAQGLEEAGPEALCPR
jgi:hypothetical protein